MITALVGLALVAALLLSVFLYGQSRQDPYTRSSLDLQGDQERGSKLFLINCAGCHGIAGQGLVGPNLHGVSRRKGDSALIQQVVSGRTPPMPKFQPDPQAMADLLAHLHTLQ
ncbi:MAG: cytochrome c [Synechococcus lacustris]|uniref:Cytochrome c-553-like protein n=1 Tax=Synechococcus lacustris str. Tous TaxID=1910958 RepID=A0A2P7EDK5_9SYNE|nr:cytochrome c [Synechococcus lacustris]MCP9794460.1 cytochrome c [Synechococcus lacustris L1F-Slac]MCP9811604.1 cytochrome c [Synechococcus lacustris Maggiore-St4-Slac]MCP9814713.1 cytochrome c [Synechococcus lacustris L1E-Slac]MCP9921716.1 cytochrome c [Synechococcus lacustris Cruz CV12-2]MCP9924573.1 cytochrome c [Synechococcus lacustris C3-12m-Tous]NBV58564.1 cytochrome c [Synechococcaceae bacterium WB4_2_0811]PSI01287.1 cytochrome c-553-like protein [Synechococcus lacustris str. Tous]